MNKKTLDRTIGKNLKMYRQNLGYNQTEIALVLKLDQPTISRIEKGKQSLTIHELFLLSKFFQVNIYQFFNNF